MVDQNCSLTRNLNGVVNLIEKIVVPSLGMSFEYVTLTKWTKNEGDFVKKDEPIAEATSDKITMDISSTIDGYLIKKLYAVNDIVPAKDVVAYIGTEINEEIPNELLKAHKENEVVNKEVEKVPIANKIVENIKSEKKKATPVAKKMIADNKLDIQEIIGTGLNGMITREDVEAFLNKKNEPESIIIESKNDNESEIIETIPYIGIRKVIGDNLTRSIHTIVHVTTGLEVDMTEAMSLRKKLLSSGKFDDLSLLTFVTRAIVEAVKKYPILNASLIDEVITVRRNVNMGVAVATPNGLIVPVIKNMQSLNFLETALSLQNMTVKGRNNKVEMNDLMGGTITLSNAGSFGATTSTPIINYPQCSILWMGKIVKKPSVVNDEIQIRSIMNLLCSYDHRVVDGSTVGMFLTEIKNSLESPETLLL